MMAEGRKLRPPYTDAASKMGVTIAFARDPNGTDIKLTEGLNIK